MPWKGDTTNLGYTFDSDIHDHWAKVLNFRKSHPAVGAGAHKQIALASGDGYAFSREKGDDKVVVVLGATAGASVTVDVSAIGAASVKDAYSENASPVTVSADGKATFTAGDSGVLLIEAATAAE